MVYSNRAWALCAWAIVATLPGPARAQAEPALSLPQAAALAVTGQPLLHAQAAAARAARESAVAAGQLPDPQLTLGLSDVPVNSAEAYSLRNDPDTQFMVGLAQEFPRAEKRRLRAQLGAHAAQQAEHELTALQLAVRRDAALAWIDAWRPERAAALARAAAGEAQAQADAVDIAYAAGRARQSELLAARVELQRVLDDVADFEQQARHARSQLSRWIGAAAYRPLAPDLPAFPPPPPLTALLARMRAHPHLDTAAAQVAIAGAGVELARAEYEPDWRLALDYGYRPEFAEMVTLQVGIDLPFFTGNRQDRRLAARLQEQTRAEALREDLWRQHEAEARLNFDDWTLLAERLARYEKDILPLSVQRIEAARLAWQSGEGTLAAVLDARRVELANRIRQTELLADAARHRVQLQYLAGEQP